MRSNTTQETDLLTERMSKAAANAPKNKREVCDTLIEGELNGVELIICLASFISHRMPSSSKWNGSENNYATRAATHLFHRLFNFRETSMHFLKDDNEAMFNLTMIGNQHWQIMLKITRALYMHTLIM